VVVEALFLQGGVGLESNHALLTAGFENSALKMTIDLVEHTYLDTYDKIALTSKSLPQSKSERRDSPRSPSGTLRSSRKSPLSAIRVR
jgi:hypothetical protein